MTESQTLLAEYADSRSEQAFTELVARYVNFVYSTALRMVGDAQLAEDITQDVFLRMSRRADKLSRESLLGGWLHRDTCFVAGKALRSERRRQAREREAAAMNSPIDHSGANLEQVAPLLDEAINQLGNEDRTAILLWFFEQRDYRAVGLALGSTEDAARMRVSRAVDKLQVLLKQRGLALSVAGLGAVLAAETVTAAPAGLAPAICAAAITSGVGGGATFALLKSFVMSKATAVLLGVAIVAGIVATVALQHQEIAGLRGENDSLKGRLARAQHSPASTESLSNLSSIASSPANDSKARELARLRNEVGLLRNRVDELASWRAQHLRSDGISAAAAPQVGEKPPPGSHIQFAEQLAASSDDAKKLMLGIMLFAGAHQNQFPASLDQATACFGTNNQPTGTNEFELLYRGSLDAIPDPASTLVLRESQAHLSPDGKYSKWARLYGFADAHCEIHALADDDFTLWEQQHAAPPPASGPSN